MSRPTVYRLLDSPGVYRLAQVLLAPGSRTLEARLHPKIDLGSAGWLLDVGSGPGTGTPRGPWRVVGVDPNPDYIRQLTDGHVDTDSAAMFARPGDRRAFGYACSCAELPFEDGRFDLTRSSRVFHHLPPDVAAATVREMVRVTKPGGRVLIVDPIYPKRGWTRPLAWVILKCDRGEYVRREPELIDLVTRAHPGEWTIANVLCTYMGVQSLIFQLTKPSAVAANVKRAA